MKDKLLERGYHKITNSEFTKGDWTVRIGADYIEVFNDPDKAAGKYFSAQINKIEIDTLLDEVDEFLLN